MRSGVWYALGAAVLFGVSGAVSVDVFDQVDPTEVATFRSLVAAFVLGAVAYRQKATAVAGHLLDLSFLGGLLSLVTITYYWAIDRLGVGPGVTIQFLGPVLILLWIRVVRRQHIGKLAWTAALVTVTGTALMNRIWEWGSVDPLGVLAGLGAAVTFAAYMIMGERLGHRLPAITMASYAFAISALIWVVVRPPVIPHHSPVIWAQLAFIGILGTTIPFMFEFAALRRIPASQVGILATSEPVMASLAAWILVDERLSPVQVAGMALVVMGVATIQRAGAPPDIPAV